MYFIKSVDGNQRLMFLKYVDDSISEDNFVRIIDEYVETLNFKEMGL